MSKKYKKRTIDDYIDSANLTLRAAGMMGDNDSIMALNKLIKNLVRIKQKEDSKRFRELYHPKSPSGE